MVAVAVAAAISMALRLFVRASPFAMTSQLDDEQPLSAINAISVSAPLTEGLNPQRNRVPGRDGAAV
jgi:hypothetical protein